mmetsp:Transcript_37968/g.63061  ORF Transcript_37968/g.63061 Transcript_37968/m.63061 type:complete len:343 (-) Transcript_37968:300-1328(-)
MKKRGPERHCLRSGWRGPEQWPLHRRMCAQRVGRCCGAASGDQSLHLVQSSAAHIVHHQLGLSKILSSCVRALRDDAGHTCGPGGQQPDSAVLHDNTVVGVQAQLLGGHVVDGGVRLLLGHHVPGKNVLDLAIQKLVHDGLHGLLVGRGAHGGLPPRSDRGIDHLLDARAQGQRARLNDVHEELGLQFVQVHDQGVVLCRGVGGVWPGAGVVVSEVACHALLPTAGGEQLSVQLHAPFNPNQALLLERLVERHAVSIALSIDDCAVAVQQECRGDGRLLLVVVLQSGATRGPLDCHAVGTSSGTKDSGPARHCQGTRGGGIAGQGVGCGGNPGSGLCGGQGL